MSRRKVGDVYQFQLSDGTYAYGHVLEDARVAFTERSQLRRANLQ